MQNSNWTHWRQRFERRANRPVPALHADLDYTQLPRSLAHSLAVFQLGESGGGRVVMEAQNSKLPGIDDDYVDALKLFVAEEHRHANILAVWVRLIGGELLRKNWTATLFVFARRCLGLRFKIMVLLAAEIAGLCYYRLLASRLPPCRLRDWLMDIVADEQDHVAFHSQFLRQQIRGPISRLAARFAWRSLMVVSRRVMLLDHRQALKDMHIEPPELSALWSHYQEQAEAQFTITPRETCESAAQTFGRLQESA